MSKRPFFVLLYAILFVMFWFFMYNHKKTDLLVENIDQFIIVKMYIKHCVYELSNSILSDKKKQAINKKSVKEIDDDINILSKKICKALSHFVRKEQVIESLQQHKDHHNDYFLLPDTLLKKSNLTFYADLLSICSNITGCSIDIEKTENNCKVYISSSIKNT